jgi:hypothetical protein
MTAFRECSCEAMAERGVVADDNEVLCMLKIVGREHQVLVIRAKHILCTLESEIEASKLGQDIPTTTTFFSQSFRQQQDWKYFSSVPVMRHSCGRQVRLSAYYAL